MPSHSAPELKLVDDTTWTTVDVRQSEVDPGLRVLASLLDACDAQQVYARTGLDITRKRSLEAPRIPVMVRIAAGGSRQTLALIERLMAAKVEAQRFALDVPRAYVDEASRNPRLAVITGRLGWKAGKDAMGLRHAVAALLALDGVKGVALPNAMHPNLDASREDIKLRDRKIGNRTLTGTGVVVGIVDDGCAFAHRHFLVPGTNDSRLLALWDQGEAPINNDPHWVSPAGFGGRELTNAKIRALLPAKGWIDEDAVYAAARYELDIASHGTHVMDIAVGNGDTLAGAEGVANKADIVFVQLPRAAVDAGGPLLEHHILEGVLYVFDRAAKANKPNAVANVSYGGYTGPHDGTSFACQGIDSLLAVDGRAAVVSAGNGFQAGCHARRVLPPGGHCDLRWLVASEDPTPNAMEIWYDPPGRLEVFLVPPGAANALQPGLTSPAWKEIRRVDDGKVVGWAQHGPMPNGATLVRIDLDATQSEDGSPAPAGWTLADQVGVVTQTSPAPSGCWRVIVRNVGDGPCEFHAWIARDDRPRRGRRGQQSRFHPDDADPTSTVADLACGKLTLCVGAHNTATNEICRYSACGPTRDGRAKPDLTAPAEETATGRGVLCASSRRGQPTPFNGTSAAAPHVAGTVALVMQERQPVPAAALRAKVIAGSSGQLGSNRVENADDSLAGKRHADCLAACTGKGKLDVPGAAT